MVIIIIVRTVFFFYRVCELYGLRTEQNVIRELWFDRPIQFFVYFFFSAVFVSNRDKLFREGQKRHGPGREETAEQCPFDFSLSPPIIIISLFFPPPPGDVQPVPSSLNGNSRCPGN